MSLQLENFDYEIKKINSWNLTYVEKAKVFYPKNIKELINIIKLCKKTKRTFAIKTGMCSYDSKSMPSNENCIIISLKKFNKISRLDNKKKIISVESGAKISNVIYFLKKKKLTLYSVPGGEHISIGGAIAANVIGKDSTSSFASFGDSIIYLKIISHSGKIKKINNHSKEFYQYIGSFGMFGIILEAKIKVKKIASSNLMLETKILKNIKEVKSELEKKSEYKYIQIDPFFRKKNFGIIFRANHVNKYENIYKNKNLNSNLFEILFFKISSFFINSVTWKIFYNLFFLLNKNKKIFSDIYNFHYTSKYKHMVPLMCRSGLIDYEILIQKDFKRTFLEIQKFLVNNNLAPIYIIIKKLFKSKKKFFYNFNKNGYALAISFRLNNLDKLKKNEFESLLSKKKLSLNLSKTDSLFVKKSKKINSNENKIFMSLYKKMLIHE